MERFILSCCSTVDLSAEHLEKRNISYICYRYMLDGREYFDDLGKTLPIKEFYAKMKEGADTKTTQLSAGAFIDYFEPMLKAGHDVLHVCLSSGITGGVNSARTAARTLSEAYPDRKLYIVDSLGASSGSGLLTDMLADLRDEGKTIDEVRDFAEANKKKIHHWFFSADLTFYIKGGRISKAAGWFGTVFRICPLMNMDSEGHLHLREKVRTKPKVIEAIVKKMEETAEGGLSYGGKCFISHSDCYEDARAVADGIEARFPKLAGKVLINDIGTTIGSHTGPETVALFYVGAERAD